MPSKHKIFSSQQEMEEQLQIRSLLEITIDGVRIGLARTKEGFYAFLNECPHNKAKLTDGICNWHNEVVCPWHEYRFDLQSGREATGRGLNLKTYHIEISEEGVYLVL